MLQRVFIGLCFLLCAGMVYANRKGYSLFGSADKIEKSVDRRPGTKGGSYRGGVIYHK